VAELRHSRRLHNLENNSCSRSRAGQADGPCAWTYIAYEPLARPLDDATRNKYSNQVTTTLTPAAHRGISRRSVLCTSQLATRHYPCSPSCLPQVRNTGLARDMVCLSSHPELNLFLQRKHATRPAVPHCPIVQNIGIHICFHTQLARAGRMSYCRIAVSKL